MVNATRICQTCASDRSTDADLVGIDMNGTADLNSKDRAGGAETVTSEKSRDVINAFLLRAVVGSIEESRQRRSQQRSAR